MEAREAHNGPHREETHDQFHGAARTLLKSEHKPFAALSPESKMCGHAAKNKGCMKGQRHDEGVEESVVAFSHTVPHPRAVMVEALHTVVTHSAVSGAGRPEHLTRGAVLEFDHLPIDGHLSGARGALVAGVSGFIDLLLDVCGFVWSGSRKDPRVAQGRLQEGDEDKYKKHTSYHRYAHSQMLDQEWAIKHKEKSSGDEDQAKGKGQHPAFPSHHDASVAEEAVPPGEHLPLPAGLPPLVPGLVPLLLRGSALGWRTARSRGWHGERLGVDLLIIAVFHVSLLPPV